MKLKELLYGLLLGTLGVLSGQVHAESTYNIQTAAALAKSDYFDYNRTDSSKLIEATYYFKPVVMDDSQPFTELSFLQRTSHVGISYTNTDREMSQWSTTTLKPLMFSGNWYVGDFFLSASHNALPETLITKTTLNQSWNYARTQTSIHLGYFVLPSTSLSLTHSQSVTSQSSVAGSDPFNDKTTTSNGLNVHTVRSLNTQDAIAADIFISRISNTDGATSGGNTAYGFNVKYFPAMNWYLQGGYATNDGDSTNGRGNTLAWGAGYQFNPQLGLLFGTSQFMVSDDSAGSDRSTAQLTLTYRF